MSTSFRDLLRQAPEFTRYFTTAVMARIANEGLRLALILYAATTPAGLQLGGLLVAAFLVPSIASAPFVGRMADLSNRPTRLYSLAFAFHGIMIVLCALSIGRVPSVITLLIAVIGGAVGPLLLGGLSSLVGSIVPQSLMPRAYAMDVVTYNVSAILAPALVAAIAGFATPFISLMFLAVLMLLASLNMSQLKITRTEDRALIAAPSPIDGFKALGSIPPLRSTVVATSLASVTMGILPVAATLLAEQTYSANAGLLLSTMAVGALVGSVSYASRPFGTERPHVMLPFVTLAGAIPLAIMIPVESTYIALGLFALSGFFRGPEGTAQFSTRDRFSPPNVRTQVFTLSTSLKTTFSAIGAAAAGFLSGASPQVLLAIAVGCTAVGAVLALADLRKNGMLTRTPISDAAPGSSV